MKQRVLLLAMLIGLTGLLWAQRNVVTVVVTIPTAGTRVKVSAASLLVRSWVACSAAANVGLVFMGDGAVSATTGIGLNPEDCIDFGPVGNGSSSRDFYDLSQFSVDTATNSNTVRILYVR